MATRAWWRPLANPGTWEAGAAGLISRPAWAAKQDSITNRKQKPQQEVEARLPVESKH